AQLRQLGFALLRSKKVGFHHGRVVKVDALTSCHGRAGFSRPPLVENAVRYTPAPGIVIVSCGRQDGRSFLRVADSGPGIPQEMQERVFERFFRLASASQPGSGLGLSIVARIADRHRAQIQLGQGIGGRGLSVTLTLP
ncbi:hypothetical protein GTP44_16620, partial [Duganella sp. FT50W]